MAKDKVHAFKTKKRATEFAHEKNTRVRVGLWRVQKSTLGSGWLVWHQTEPSQCLFG